MVSGEDLRRAEAEANRGWSQGSSGECVAGVGTERGDTGVDSFA